MNGGDNVEGEYENLIRRGCDDREGSNTHYLLLYA